MNTIIYKKQSDQIKHQGKKSYINENSKSLTTWNIEKTLRKSQNPSRRQKLKTNLESNTKPNIHERLRQMSPSKKHQNQGKSLSQTISKTSDASDDKQQQKINEVEEEIRKLKRTQNITAGTTNIDHKKIKKSTTTENNWRYSWTSSRPSKECN